MKIFVATLHEDQTNMLGAFTSLEAAHRACQKHSRSKEITPVELRFEDLGNIPGTIYCASDATDDYAIWALELDREAPSG